MLDERVPADRRARVDRRPAHGRAGRHRRHDRLVLLPALRLAERLRLDPRRARGAAATGSRPTADDWTPKQLYFPDTNVLITRFLTADGVGEVQDFMPVGAAPAGATGSGSSAASSRFAAQMRFALEVEPRFDYGRDDHEVDAATSTAPSSARPSCTLALRADGAARAQRAAASRAEFTLGAGESATFVLERVPGDYVPRRLTERRDARARSTARSPTGARWLAQSRYSGPLARDGPPLGADAEAAHLRSPTGAIVAAPTTSLPEQLGGERNWDYRYTWIRDAAFSLYALLRLGFTEEAAAFMDWLTERFRERPTRRARARCRSCTASTAAPSSTRRSSTTSRATAARRRCGSATAPPTSSSSTSTAS